IRKMIERVPDVSRVGGHLGQGTGADPRPHPDRLESETETIARLIALENGKPRGGEEGSRVRARLLREDSRHQRHPAAVTPIPALAPRDVTCQTQTPAAPGAIP